MTNQIRQEILKKKSVMSPVSPGKLAQRGGKDRSTARTDEKRKKKYVNGVVGHTAVSGAKKSRGKHSKWQQRRAFP